MPSTPPQYANGLPKILPTEEETPYSTPKFRPEIRRTTSFSSSSQSNSSDSSFESSPIFSFTPPYSPIASTPVKFIGIPFSWEKTPGIPKNHHGFKKMESSGGHLLPLPPPAGSYTKKWGNKDEVSHISSRFRRDPFFAALVECSKDDRRTDNYTNTWKASLKFINMYTTSCKRACAVSESIVYLPRPSPHYLIRRPHRARSSS